MELIILLLILLILAPSLVGALLLPVILLLLFLIPLRLLFHSVITLIHAPRSLIEIATSPRVRRNHALEHATVNVLEERYGDQNFAGYATANGFKIVGSTMIPPEAVYEAAEEGLKRLQAGEKRLAVHKRCGTSQLMVNLIFSILFLLLLLKLRYFNFLAILGALILAQIVGRSMGGLVQRWLTTSTAVRRVYIEGIEVEVQSGNPFVGMLLPPRFFIKTSQYASYRKDRSTPEERTAKLIPPGNE